MSKASIRVAAQQTKTVFGAADAILSDVTELGQRYVAYLDPTEGPRGYGETEDEAKADLLRQIEQREARS